MTTREGMQPWTVGDLVEGIAIPVSVSYLRQGVPAPDAEDAGPAWGSCLVQHAGRALHALQCGSCETSPVAIRYLQAWGWLWTWQ